MKTKFLLPILFFLLACANAFAEGELEATGSGGPAPAAEPTAPPPATEPAAAPEGPDISGVPQEPAATSLTTADEVRAAAGGDEAGCKTVPAALRAMAFRHFENAQEMHNAQGRYFPPKAAEKAAHLLGMVLKESSGDPTNTTDMNAHEFGTYQALSNLDRWKKMFDQPRIRHDKQTNYGLAQMSMDRLLAGNTVNSNFDRFLQAGDRPTTGQDTRRIISLYQDFAQGRLKQEDRKISEKEAKDPNASAATKERVKAGLDSALWHCGTRFLFKEGYAGAEGKKALEDAMSSIAYCDPGTKSPNPANEAQRKCFARWVTLCPALNLDIAILTPDSYFATHRAPSMCQKTFQKLTKAKPATGH